MNKLFNLDGMGDVGAEPTKPEVSIGPVPATKMPTPKEVVRAISQDEFFKDATPQQITDRMRTVEKAIQLIKTNIQIADDESRKNYFTHVLTDDTPTISLDAPFVVTHIYRDDECYDELDTSTNAYGVQKIQLYFNGHGLFSEEIPVPLLPKTGEYAYELACPYYLARNSNITLSGGTGLTDLKIALGGYYQCYSVISPPNPHIFVVESHMVAGSPELNPTANIPSWMFSYHKFIHCAQIFETSSDTWTYNKYGHASSNYMNGRLRIPYPHGNMWNLRNNEPARMYAGSREFPFPMVEEFMTPGVAILWNKSTTTFDSNDWYDYLLMGSAYFGLL